MITKETLELLINTAKAAAGPHDLGLTTDGRRRRLFHEGTITNLPEPPTSIDHVVHTLGDLITFAERDVPGDPPQSVWHSDSAVVLLCDERDRRDRVTFRLSHWEALVCLQQISSQPQQHLLDQRGFIRLLELVLGTDKALITPFRRLNWKTSVSANGDVQSGRDRLGREVNAEVSGTTDLPDEILVHTPVYRERGEREVWHIRCRIETFPAQERILIQPYPGEIEAAIEGQQQAIHDRLVDGLHDGVPVYYGEP